MNGGGEGEAVGGGGGGSGGVAGGESILVKTMTFNLYTCIILLIFLI